jgi:hypothetical protein
MQHNRLTLAGLLLPLLLAACGGGSGGGDSASTAPETPEPTTPPVVTPPTTPPVTPAADRIEPFDPSAAAKTLAAAGAQPPLARVSPQNTPSVHLAALEGAQAKSTALVALGAPLSIGQGRDVAATATAAATAALLQWQRTSAGTQAAALRFVADGAYGVRLGVRIEALPAQAVLRFYGADESSATSITGAELQDLIARNVRAGASDAAAHTYWSPDFGGPQTTLEIEIPGAADPAAVRLAVPRVSHFTQSPDQAQADWQQKVGESGSCNMDLTCSPQYLDQSRSVARMLFVHDDGQTYLCTGTLVNDAASSGTPYFLSANHCISTQSVASTLTTDWFYRSASCNSASVNPETVRVTGGATLLYASAATDTSFMRLNRAAPAGIVYAGSYFGDLQPGAALAGVHHPKGDLQKLSLGTLLGFSNCSTTQCSSADAGTGSFLRLAWQQGTTEGGSSGSAAFVTLDQKRYVVGQLLGGNAGCAAPSGSDFYGRFDVSYRAAIKQWLNP